MLLILNTSNTVVGTLARFGTTNKVTPYFDDTHVEDLSSGAETFTFSTFANTKEAYNLTVGNSIAFKVKNGYKLFQITEVTETHNEEFIKSCYCEMVGIELLNEVVRPFSSNSMSLKQFLTTILQDTDYSIGRIDSSLTLTHDIEVTSHTKVYSLLQDYVINKYEAEISFRVEIQGGRIVGKYIDCELERGDFKGTRFEYSKNITNVRKSIDYSELATALIGVGTNDLTFRSIKADDKPLNQDFIANENSYALWNKKGKHIFDVYKYETESPTELLNATRKELKRRCNPKFKYEVDVELLTQEVSIGDTVYIIDNEFNPPLHLSARVSQLSTCRTDASQNKCILSNYKEVVSSITAHIGDGQITSTKIGKGAITNPKISDNAVDSRILNLRELFVEDSAFIENLHATKIKASQLEVDTIRNDLINLNGVISFEAMNEDMGSLFIRPEGVDKTYINGGNIFAKSISADAIELKGLSIVKDGYSTLAISEEGDISLTGDIASKDYSDVVGNERGYKLSANGDAVLNNAIVRGDGILPNAGMTNYGGSGNPVRFWAGATYDNRDNAPFKVYQDGTIVATRGNFGGTFTGSVHQNSDANLKENIKYIDDYEEPITASLTHDAKSSPVAFKEFIRDELKPATFNYKKSDLQSFGFIAQDIADSLIGQLFIHEYDREIIDKTLDEGERVVRTEKTLSFDLAGFTTVVARALQEEIRTRDIQIEELKKEIRDLKERV